MAKKVAAAGPIEGRWTLPEGWSWYRARDIAKIVGGSTPKNAADTTNYSEDGTPWLTPADLSGYNKATIGAGRRNLAPHVVNRSSLLPAGAVLISSRAPVGYCAIASNPMVTNQGFRSLVLADGIDPFFIRYYVLFSRKYLEDHASGTTFKELSGGALGDLVFPIPPLDVQRTIVSRIDELFAEIDDGEAALARARDDLATWRKALLKAAVTGELTADWRVANPLTETGTNLLARILADRRARWDADPANIRKKYKDPLAPLRRLTRLPESWTSARLEQLTSRIVDGTHHTPTYVDQGVPFLSVKDIRDGKLHFNACRFISDNEHRELSKRCNPTYGDLLVTKSGTIGRTAVVRSSNQFSLFVSVALLKPASDLISGEWLEFAFHHWFRTADVAQDVKGTAIKNLHLEDFRELVVPLPPLEEQVAIMREHARILSAMPTNIYETATEAAATLRQSILAAAFRGELA